MSGGGRGGPSAAELARLAVLARLKADQALARLGQTAQSRARLRAALDGLGRAEDPLAPGTDDSRGAGAGGAAEPEAPAPIGLSPLLVRARIAHRAWLDRQRAELLVRLARVEADWHRLRPPAAQAFGRARVLDDLAAQAAQDERRARLADRP